MTTTTTSRRTERKARAMIDRARRTYIGEARRMMRAARGAKARGDAVMVRHYVRTARRHHRFALDMLRRAAAMLTTTK